MNWLPLPEDFSAQLRAARKVEDPGQRRARLCALTQYRLDYIQTTQLAAALNSEDFSGDSGLIGLKLAVLSTCTIDHLVPALQVAGLRHGFWLTIYAGQYGQFRQEVMAADSPLVEFAPDIVLLSLNVAGTLGQWSISATNDQIEQVIDSSVEELTSLWQIIRDRFEAQVIQQTFLDVSEPLFGNHDRLIPAAPSRVTMRLNDRLAERVAESGALLLDVARASARDGLAAWFDPARWLQGKFEISPLAAPDYAELTGRLLGAQFGRSRKCLVLDLDNTLWGGIVGEVGLEGLDLGEGSAAGEAHLALQRYAKSLQQRGVVLAVCSKNEAPIVEQVFAEHPDMLLRRSDFAAFRVNWLDKADNLISIAEELNLGLESFVFVDDSPDNRLRIRDSLPMVAVPEMPEDPAGYTSCLAAAGYFEAVSFTDEDLQRSGRYAANVRRNQLRESVQSLEEFLQNLDMSIAFGPVRDGDMQRAHQLLNKTNQFNTTNVKYSEAELTSFTAERDNLALQFRISDRLGDNGLVSVITTSPGNEDSEALEIVNWVMSCRVFGRQLEDEVMNIVVETARSRGIRFLQARYIPSARNQVIRDLFAKLGFSCEGAHDNGETRWSLDLMDYEPRQTFFTRSESP